MSTPHITALLNTYNHGPFIEEAVESALRQDLPGADFEVIVVDDGSTDDTAERVRRFGGRVRYFHKPNGGQSSAVNFGFAQARGDIVALLDGDDVWLPGKLRCVAEAFERNPRAVMVSHKRLVWEMASGTCWEDDDLPVLSGQHPPTSLDLLRHAATSTSALAFRTELIRAALPIPEALVLHADSYLIVLSLLIAPVVSLNQALTKYRLHDTNLFHFQAAEPERAQNRLRWMQAWLRETKAWIVAHGFDLTEPSLAAYVARFDLVEQAYRFDLKSPGRLEFFRHLRTRSRVYGPLWTWRYRIFQQALSFAALALGYGWFSGLRRAYAKRSLPLEVRRKLIPVGQASAAL
jgi:hypothetical protein